MGKIDQHFVVEWFLDEFDGSHLHSRNCGCDIRISRHENHGQSLIFAEQLFVKLKPILLWHANIEDQTSRHFRAVKTEKLTRAAECVDLKFERSQQCDEGLDERPVVIDDKNARNLLIAIGHAVGTSKR